MKYDYTDQLQDRYTSIRERQPYVVFYIIVKH